MEDENGLLTVLLKHPWPPLLCLSQEKITHTGHRTHVPTNRRHNSLGPFGLTTIGSDGDGADLSPAARSGGLRRRPRAQAALLERDDLFEDSLRIMHHSGLGDPLGVVHEVRLGPLAWG